MKIRSVIVITAVVFNLPQFTYAQCPQICDSGPNTALGQSALVGNTAGMNNTAVGFQALQNSNADGNTATGSQALASNISGTFNTALGMQALLANTGTSFNTATGAFALSSNTTGSNNTAVGYQALSRSTSGGSNTAIGTNALGRNTVGPSNTAVGQGALGLNTTSGNNTAVGFNALNKNRGANNIALGYFAGFDLTFGANNIAIGSRGVAGESSTIRIGTTGTQAVTYIAGISGVTVSGGVGVLIDSNGRLGTNTSSARYKEQIKPMDKASEALLSLKPVTFRYKEELDPKAIPQFGLVAEQVEKVNPDLVVRDDAGKPYSVRYEAVNAMLLNEFLKEHRRVETQSSEIAELKGTLAKQQSADAEQQKEIKALRDALKEQAAQIEKVSAQLARMPAAPRLVTNE